MHYTLGIDVAKRRYHATLLGESGDTVIRNIRSAAHSQGLRAVAGKVSRHHTIRCHP